jgi:environmental stress-induced protein Ves
MLEIIRKEELITRKWSGGTTTQLYIYPESASYEKRDFIFRISTASVDTEESSFTQLPSISRNIMVLEGEMKLIHKDRHTIKLKKFETDKFSGDWETKSYGKVIDFNLMTPNEETGFLSSSILDKGEIFKIDKLQGVLGIALYIVKGSANLAIAQEEILINTGDFIINIFELKGIHTQTILTSQDNCEIAIAIINRS